MFPATSRYYRIEKAVLETAGGREIIYLRRRFLPPASNALALTEHLVSANERLDNVTARYLGDPEQFWRLGDANNAMNPDELTAEIGRRLIIPIIQ
jgi:hypothetical protein